LKIDLAISVEAITSANSSLTFEVRLYRNGTLIATRTIQRNLSAAGTQRFPMANTFVDTAIATTTSIYEVRVIFTTATNVTSATALNRNINIISF
jgi:multidrug efflux pump subunit AcrA (membrane-fusion protein)